MLHGQARPQHINGSLTTALQDKQRHTGTVFGDDVLLG